MLSIANVSAAQAENYYEKDDYYTRDLEVDSDPQGAPDLNAQWYGKGAVALGLTGDFDQTTFQSLLHGQAPDGQSLHARKIDPEHHRAATDCTFSAPKSVSIAALIQGDRRVLSAHTQAVKTSLSILEDRYAQTRVRRPQGERERVTTGNLVAAVFRHETSREQDPQLHSHCVIINATQMEDGHWRSLSNDAILANQKLLGEIYQNELAFQLRQHGYEIETLPNGQFELKGYEPELLDTFSTRTQQIEAYLEQWEASLADAGGAPLHRSQKKQATLDTRRRKTTLPREVLLDGWAHTIREQGLTLPQVQNVEVDLSQASQKRAAISADSGIHHAAERESVFRRAKAERFALEHSLGEQCFADLTQAIEHHSELIEVDTDAHQYTTQTAIDREVDTIRIMQDGQGQVRAISTAEQVTDCLEENPTFTRGQRQAIELSATTSDRVIAWQGVAGAGKTYSLKLYAALAEAHGYTIKGYAPSAQAASVLSREAGIPSETVARLLHTPTDAPDKPSQGNEIWIVDEAGLLSAKDAHALLQRAKANQARVILVGDIRQLSAVEAGNPFKSLQAAGIQTAYLSESRRQQTEALKTAVNQIAQGQLEEGIQQLDDVGLIHEVAPAERFTQITQDYLNLTPTQRQQTLILSGTNAERLALIGQLRTALQAEGSLGEDRFTLQSLRPKDLTTAQAKYVRHYEVGDVIVPVKDYRRHGLERHQQYTVTALDVAQNQLTLENPTGKTLTLNPAHCAKKTAYRVQRLAIAPGDQLRWTRNDRDLGVRNGQGFTVTAIDAQGLAHITSRDGETRPLDLTGKQYVDYALVSTTYSSQGKTADRVLVAADSTLNREAFYVAVSRAKRYLSLYTPSKAELTRTAQRSKAKENASDYLPLFQVVTPHAPTSKTPDPTPTVDHRDDGRRIGERLASQLATPLRRNRRAEVAARRLDLSTARFTASLDGTDRPGATTRYAPDPTIQTVSRQLATAVEQQRERLRRAASKRRYRQLYERYETKLGAHDPRQRDRLIVQQVLADRLRAQPGQKRLSHEDVVHAAYVVARGDTAQGLKQSQGQPVAAQYVERLITAEVRRLEQAQQRSRGFDFER
ncbi:MAG: MobF family relaxase [Cyanobacteria bacterium P01_G01_bin.38]